MIRRRSIASFLPAFALALTLFGATPASAQFSDSYTFLRAVRDADGEKVTKSLAGAGSTLINTRDYSTGETALIIVTKRRDLTWMSFLMGKGANPNGRDGSGNTALIVAAQLGFNEGVQFLIDRNAQINLGNNSGETPLIIATQQRNAGIVRLLLANGADPRQADRIAGKSARDYAREDGRAVAILKLLDEAPAAKAKPKIAGPGL